MTETATYEHEGPSSNDAGQFPYDDVAASHHLGENPGAIPGPSSHETCGQFPMDEVLAASEPPETPPDPPVTTTEG